MTSTQAQYLLRFDDLCPTMSKERWNVFLAIVNQHALRPILAIVPDNHDPELKIDSPDPQFWNEMFTLEARGATIAMHGYWHLCESAGKSILGLHRKTEFAGVEETTQRRGYGTDWRFYASMGFLRACLWLPVTASIAPLSGLLPLRGLDFSRMGSPRARLRSRRSSASRSSCGNPLRRRLVCGRSASTRTPRQLLWRGSQKIPHHRRQAVCLL
jgi:hypothetical protein